MATADHTVLFNQSAGSGNSSHTISDSLNGSTLYVYGVGTGGSGSGAPNTSGDTQNIGGGGGGAGGMFSHTLTVQAGDVIECTTTSSPGRNTGITALNGGDSVLIHKRNGSEISRLIARGGGGGTQGTGGAGGSTTGSGGAVAIDLTTDGGDGGDGADCTGSNGSSTGGGPNPLPSGNVIPGAAGSNGSDASTLTFETAGGGGGGAPGIPPSWFTTAAAAAGLSFEAGAGDGGDGGSTAAHTTGTRTATSTTFKTFDGAGDHQAGSTRPGYGGGGAGIPWFTTGASDGFGGAGGEGLIAIQYKYDSILPVITLIGKGEDQNDPLVLDKGDSFADPGANATVEQIDGTEEPRSVSVTYTAALSAGTAAVGNYEVVYQSTNDDGQSAFKTRYVRVSDLSGPEITLNGAATVQILNGDTYNDLGATAFDSVDGDLTSSIVTVNNVDTSTNGTYQVTYNVDDSVGNAASQKTRTVIVGDVKFDIANSSNPKATPASGQIKFSEIQAARQLFKSSSSAYSQTGLGGDAGIRYLQRVSINDLRNWYIKYAFGGGAGTVSNNTNPGSKGTSGLAGSSANQSEVNISDFYDYAALSITARAKPESFDTYRNKDDAALYIKAHGARHSSDSIYTIAVQLPSDDASAGAAAGAWETETQRNGRGNEFTMTNIGGFKTTRHGTSDRNSSWSDPKDVRTYNIKISWKNSSTGSTINYTGSKIKIGHAGTTDTKYINGEGDEISFRWSGSSTGKAGAVSSRLIEHVGFSSVERI